MNEPAPHPTASGSMPPANPRLVRIIFPHGITAAEAARIIRQTLEEYQTQPDHTIEPTKQGTP